MITCKQRDDWAFCLKSGQISSVVAAKGEALWDAWVAVRRAIAQFRDAGLPTSRLIKIQQCAWDAYCSFDEQVHTMLVDGDEQSRVDIDEDGNLVDL